MKRDRQYPILNKRTSTRRTILAMAAAVGLSAAYSAHAATQDWIGATDGIWGTATNWSGGAVPDSTYNLTILGPNNLDGALNINIAAPASANSINFTSTAAVTLTNTTSGANQNLTLGAGGLTVGSGPVTIGSATANQNINIALTSSQTWSIGSGGLTASNVISGTGFSITKTGTGTLTLSGANSFNGGLTISEGSVLSTAAQGFGAGGSTVSIGAAGTATVTLAADLNVNNIFTGNGTLTVTGSTGTPNFNNASALNGFTGTFNVNTSGGRKVALTTAGGKIGSGATVNITSGGTLYIANTTASFDGVTFNVVGSGNTEGFGAIRIENGSVIGATSSVVLGGDTSLGAQNGSAGTINAVISESTASALTKVGNQTLILGGANTYTGATILTAGTLSVSTDSAGAYNLGGSGTNGIIFNGGTLQVTGTTMTNFGSHTPTFTATKTVGLDIANVANNFTISQTLDQTTGGLTKTGAGTLTLSGPNTYSGGTRANAGTLVLSGSHTKAAGTTDFLSLNNVGAQNAVVRITSTAGTQAYNELNQAEATNARGAVYQEGGAFSTANIFRVAGGTGSYGYYSLSGGTITNSAGDTLISSGASAVGAMDVTGGSFGTSSWIVLGRSQTAGNTGSGLLNVTGGSVTSTGNNVALNWAPGSGAISILNVGGGAGAASVTGASNASNYLDLSQVSAAGTTGVVNLRANGTLTVAQVRVTGAASTALFNFNGGTLRATTTNTGGNFMNDGDMDAVTVYTGGGTIDNNGTNITIGNVLGAATGNGVTSIAVTDGGSGYIGAPLVKITGGTGNSATGYAVMANDGTGNGTYRVSSIVITSPGTYSVDPTTVTLTGGGASTVASLGTITTAANSSGGMTFSGSGTTTLSVANTYSGGTTLSAGTLLLGNATAAGSGTIKLAGGTLGASANNLSVANALNVTGSNVLGHNANNSVTLSGALLGSGTLSNFNSGTANSGTNVFFTGDLSGFTGTLNYTNSSTNSSAWWRFTTADLSGASVILNAGTGSTKNFGFRDNTTGGTLQIGALSGDGAFQGSFGSGTNTLQVGGLNTDTTFSGTIGIAGGNTANLNLVKVGTGTLTLSGSNSYTGATTVSAGTLAVNGSIISNVTIDNTGTLRGTGTVKAVSVSSSTGSVAPGNSIGKLTVGGNFTLGTGKLVTELSKTSFNSLVAGTDYDQLAVTSGNTVDVTNGTLALQFGDNLVNGDVYYILDNQGSNAVAGTFAGATINGVTATGSLADGGTFSALYGGSTYSFTISYFATASGGTNDIALTAVSVPEPGMSMSLLGLGAWGLMSRRRKSAVRTGH